MAKEKFYISPVSEWDREYFGETEEGFDLEEEEKWPEEETEEGEEEKEEEEEELE